MKAYNPSLQALLAPAVESMGFELVGVEYRAGSRDGLLRVYIDREEGIDVDDCAKVSHQVSGILDVEDPVPGHYTLEVSSPGLDRPLFSPEHFQRFTGQKVKLRLSSPTAEGRRKFTAEILGVQGQTISLQDDDRTLALPFEQIESARLVPEY